MFRYIFLYFSVVNKSCVSLISLANGYTVDQHVSVQSISDTSCIFLVFILSSAKIVFLLSGNEDSMLLNCVGLFYFCDFSYIYNKYVISKL